MGETEIIPKAYVKRTDGKYHLVSGKADLEKLSDAVCNLEQARNSSRIS